MPIYMRAFKKEDLKAFEPIESLSKDELADPEFAQAVEDSGLAVTAMKDGKPFGCCGVHPVDEVNGELWLRLSKDCLKHKIGTMRWIKEGLKIVEETYPFSQLNASIKCCFEQSIKMIEYLGFKKTQEVIKDGVKWYIYSKRVQNGIN